MLTTTEKHYPSGKNVERIKFIAPSTLEVEYQMGKVYQYQNVPEEVFAQALEAISIGQFLTDNVKRKYQFIRVK